MPPKSKKRRQSLEAAAKGREILKKAHLSPDGSVSTALPTANTDGAGLDHAGDSAVQHEEPGPSHGQTDATGVDVSPLDASGAEGERCRCVWDDSRTDEGGSCCNG